MSREYKLNFNIVFGEFTIDFVRFLLTEKNYILKINFQILSMKPKRKFVFFYTFFRINFSSYWKKWNKQHSRAWLALQFMSMKVFIHLCNTQTLCKKNMSKKRPFSTVSPDLCKIWIYLSKNSISNENSIRFFHLFSHFYKTKTRLHAFCRLFD